MYQYQAILLIGPTGSGKTPLGELIERQGLWGHKCAHFDFGENLRKIAATNPQPSFLTEQDMALIRDSLETGALLENETFHIASVILRSFVQKKEIDAGDILILNGLPRHVDQARDVGALLDIVMIVYLQCTAETVQQRIQLNSGGDRAERNDDSLAEIEGKLGIFYERTMPLLDHYRAKGVKVEQIPITADTTADEIHRILEGDHLF